MRYALARPETVRIVVFDLLGHEVATLVDGERTQGVHTAEIRTAALANDVYVCRM